ncbi:hypothetical protein ANN_17286 [Periplaneta americana]|uniref:Uncharacterized protein n=1 Tax=Periplaneta americana TaxID=6978 RepID=A0ABQ8STQ3_PERAM|nr:hypothetical protein ANN_17286 [Periplaneta americana]
MEEASKRRFRFSTVNPKPNGRTLVQVQHAVPHRELNPDYDIDDDDDDDDDDDYSFMFQGDRVRDAAWDCDWVGTPVSFQRSLVFVIACANKEFKLTAGKCVPVTKQTMMNVRLTFLGNKLLLSINCVSFVLNKFNNDNAKIETT